MSIDIHLEAGMFGLCINLLSVAYLEAQFVYIRNEPFVNDNLDEHEHAGVPTFSVICVLLFAQFTVTDNFYYFCVK